MVRENKGKLDMTWPVRKLSCEQEEIKNEALNFVKSKIEARQKGIFVIGGRAGTGKSVLVTALFNEIQAACKDKSSIFSKTKNYVLVNHPEMLKFYKRVAGESPILLKKNFDRPTSFINRIHKSAEQVDIVIIDEAHLLLTKKDAYNHFYQENQLQEILKYARIVILIFDNKQVLKAKSYWSKQKLAAILGEDNVKIRHLQKQFRIEANVDVQNWISDFCSKKISHLPAKQKFDFRIMNDAKEMYELVKVHEKTEGLSRLLATYDFPYRLDGNDYFVKAGNLSLRWDRSKPQESLAWAERADTIDEVGSVYTIQGFDLNYAGIILGPSLGYDEQLDKIVVRSEFYEDQAAFNGIKHLDTNIKAAKERLILNALNVLLTRARKGLYIYAVDSKLRKKLLQN
ncbi:DUF2075 domain-containing protein [Liquorilactobacillus mali]|uniref:AAA+ ATPase domain-containing protein n=1 Tax=Liquorilactobacillus mali TaxID=1618 RepID=A0A0R2FG44_9LACO|nr:DUF2075 domain-containing protein [Liquorilactobacillus mali]KRN27528.1 hypothetical protein IV36_GL000978 [Liquorilactobacillus mali]